VIGDTVNTASRVEAATRETGDDVLITEATRVLLRRLKCEFDQRPPVPLRGKRQVVQLWAPRVSVGAGADVLGAAADGARVAAHGVAGGARAGPPDGAVAGVRTGADEEASR
jgi:Adenylate and Guanylate cyclase catalytic domain